MYLLICRDGMVLNPRYISCKIERMFH